MYMIFFYRGNNLSNVRKYYSVKAYDRYWNYHKSYHENGTNWYHPKNWTMHGYLVKDKKLILKNVASDSDDKRN